MAECARLCLGITGAFAFLTVLRLNLAWFTPSVLARATGVSVTLGMIGGMVAQAPFQALLSHMPWRDAVTWTAHVGIVFLLLISYLVPEYEPQTHDKQTSFASILTSIWTPIKNGQNWLGDAICFLNLPIFVFGAGWGLMYLSEYHHVSRYHASLVVSMIFIGMMIGSPMMGWFSDRFYFSMKNLSFLLMKVNTGGNCFFYLPLA